MDVNNLSSNWKRLQASLKTSKPIDSTHTPPRQNALKRKHDQSRGRTKSLPLAQGSLPRKKPRIHKAMGQDGTAPSSTGSIKEIENTDSGSRPRLLNPAFSDHVNAGLSPSVEVGRYVAIDCEMVGVGPNPDRESALARVSIVNYNGDQVYDSFVIPLEEVTDWRTHVSGVAPIHMKHARTMKEVQQEVAKILQDKVLVGHAVRHDLDALLMGHPKRDIRDTARHPPYRKLAGGSSPRLKILASELLGLQIQEGEHSSVEDARASMLLFRRDKAAFEREHLKRWPTRPYADPPPNADDQSEQRKPKKKKKKKKH